MSYSQPPSAFQLLFKIIPFKGSGIDQPWLILQPARSSTKPSSIHKLQKRNNVVSNLAQVLENTQFMLCYPFCDLIFQVAEGGYKTNPLLLQLRYGSYIETQQHDASPTLHPRAERRSWAQQKRLFPRYFLQFPYSSLYQHHRSNSTNVMVKLPGKKNFSFFHSFPSAASFSFLFLIEGFCWARGEQRGDCS